MTKEKKGLFDILVEIDKLCRKHSINYWLDSGTLLGAIRHKGFIPWDDDIDIAMPREDYDNFINIAKNELPKHLVCQTKDTDPKYQLDFLKVRDTKSVVDEITPIHSSYSGLFIDVFPIEVIDRKNIKVYIILRKLYHINPNKKAYGSLFNNIINKLLSPLTIFKSGYYYICKSILPSNDGDTYVKAIETPFSSYFPKNDNFKLIDGIFEGSSFLIPNNYDDVLSNMYGDYMKIPPESERLTHFHNVKVE